MTRRTGQRRSRWRRFRRRLSFALASLACLAGGALLWTRGRDAERDGRIAALERTRDALRARLAALAAGDPVVASAPEGDLLIGIPEAVGSDLIGHASAAFLSRVEIELADLHVHKAGTVGMDTPVGHMTPGDFELDVRIRSVRGILEPGPPRVRFRGRGIDVDSPVRLARGEGRATLRLRWSSRGVAGAFCKGFETRLQVKGTIVPRSYAVAGRLEGALDGGTITAVPSFPDLEVNLQVEPSRESWQALDRVLAERGFRCRAALKLVDVPGQVRRVLEKGFDVKVPPTIVRPLSFPAALQQELEWEGRHVRLEARPRELAVGPGLVWYSADVATGEGSSATAGAQPTLQAQAAPTPSAEPAPTPADTPAATPAATPEPPPTPEASPLEAPSATPAGPPVPAPTPTPVPEPPPTPMPELTPAPPP